MSAAAGEGLAPMRIAVAGFAHESNTFAEGLTTLDDFRRKSLHFGADLGPVWRDAHHEIGGMLAGLEALGYEAVPLLAADAVPGGPLSKDCYETIVGWILDRLAAAGPVDGILLALHGAMVAEHFDSADAETCRRVRAAIGPDKPFILSLDMHGNITPPMIDEPDATVVYRTYPHVDQRERGLEAAAILGRMLRGEIRPRQAMARPPMLLHIVQQYSGCGPLAEIMTEVVRVAEAPGMISAFFAPGYIYADVPNMGPSAIAIADGDIERARAEARRLAEFAWTRRVALNTELPSPAEAVAQAVLTPGCVALMDCGDNIGGGGPGDSTILFSEIRRQGARGAIVVLYDPEAVIHCAAAGVGARVELQVGAKTDSRHGRPAAIAGTVRMLHDGRFVEPEARHGGIRFWDQGLTAVIETDDGHLVVLDSKRTMPMSLRQVLSLGVDLREWKMVVVKGATAPRAAYEPTTSRVICVDTPGVTQAGPESFTYRRRPRPLYPLEPEAEF